MRVACDPPTRAKFPCHRVNITVRAKEVRRRCDLRHGRAGRSAYHCPRPGSPRPPISVPPLFSLRQSYSRGVCMPGNGNGNGKHWARLQAELNCKRRRVAWYRVRELGPLEAVVRSEEHTSELQSPCNLVCRLLLEKKKKENVDAASTYGHHSADD